MTRKLALLLAACLGLWHGSAWALGLGEIDVRSSLNERFSATIDLRRIESLSQNEIIASLASSEDFARLGVQRFFYLSELEFTTDLSERSRPRILVTSNRPINEPFVHFVVDVRWPTGRMLREYTVLLDPPNYGSVPAPAARPRQQAAAPGTPPPAAAPDTAPPARTQPSQVRTAAQASPGTGRFDGNSYGVTDRNDTLWAIALQVRPSTNVSVHQTMLALQRLNPDAFIGGNINLLKAGHVLRVPSADEIVRLSRQDAVVQVAEHNARWRSGTPVMPLDARPAVVDGERATRPTGELRLVAGDDDGDRISREGSPAGSGALDALRGDLAAAESRLSEAEAARSAAERQRQAAANELEEVSRQLELRNQELARLQRELAQQQAAPVAPRPAAGQGAAGMDWMLLAAGLAGLVILAAAVLLLLRRRRGRSDEMLPVSEETDSAGKPSRQTLLMSAISKEDLARAGIAGAVGVGSDVGEADQERDVIAEADVYMAYGRFSEAARVLNAAIATDGQRADLRLKLMEVLVETRDVEAFNAEAEVLRGFADQQTIVLADELADRLPGAVMSTGDTSDGDSSGPLRSADEGEINLDFDLSDDFGEPADLDSLDIDFDASNRPKPVAAALAGEEEGEEEGDGEGDEELTLVLDDDGAADARSGASGLDLDLDFEEPDKALKAAAHEGPDDWDLAFDLDDDDASLAETLARGEPTVRAPAPESRGMGDFDSELSAEDAAASKSPEVGATAGTDGYAALSEEPSQEAQPQTLAADTDPEFDLTIDGTGFVERPRAEATSPDQEEGGFDDLEFDLAGGAADTAEASAGGQRLAQEAVAESNEIDDEGDDLHFDIEDLPPETSNQKAPSAQELSPPAFGALEENDREGLAEGRLPGAGDDNAEFSFEGFDHDSEESNLASNEAVELPVDLADDDFELGMGFDEAGDETTTKLELARAYIDMGDEDGAKEILDEVVRDGNESQQQEAAELFARLG